MPRPDRGVAQRYAAKKRKRRQRLSSAAGPPLSAGTAVVHDAPDAAISPAPSEYIENRRRTGLAEPAPILRARPASGRPFSSYADEYRYVLGDLRRVALVAGSLLLSLIVLSFFIR